MISGAGELAASGDVQRLVLALNALELHLLLQAIARHVLLHVGDHRLTIAAIASRGRAPPSTRQYTVSRIISGGSAGFRTMIALPRVRAADDFDAPYAVVSVNSSMLARVPGPARCAEAIDDTISA